MKILLLSSYFKPEQTSGEHLGEDLRAALAKAGHTMELYAPTPTRGVSDEVRREYAKNRKHEQEFDGALQIHRFSLWREGKNSLGRALRYAVLELQLLWCGLRAKEIDLLPMASTPPINGLMGTALKKLKKIPFVYAVHDMFPETLVTSGLTHRGSLLWKIGSWVSRVTYKNAAHIMVISDSMKAALIADGVPEEKITVTYNWIDTDVTHPIAREENPLFDELGLDRNFFYVTYAGNLGNSQNAELLVDCAERLKEKEQIRFVIFGNGTEKEKIVARITESGLDNIVMFPMQPLEKVSQVYSLADVSCVLCKKGVGGSAFPSKAASIMATATPVLASFDEDSDLCAVVRNGKAGLCVPPENAEAMAAAVKTLFENRVLCASMGENARSLAETKFSKAVGTAGRIAVYEKFARKR